MLPMNMPQTPQHELSAAKVQRLLELFDQPEASMLDLQMALTSTWGAGFVKPFQQLPRERWVELFRRTGYYSLGTRPTAPTAPVQLYRGATEGWERGISWTTSPAMARQFDTALWTVVTPPSAVLAVFPMHHYDEHGNDWREYILDIPEEVAVVETSAPGHGGKTLPFRGRTVEAVDRSVRRFLADTRLDDLRKSALGWEALHPRRKNDLAAVTFYGYPAVLAATALRHARWHE